MWQRGGGGGGEQMLSPNFEFSNMYNPVVDLTFHLIEYDSNTVIKFITCQQLLIL